MNENQFEKNNILIPEQNDKQKANEEKVAKAEADEIKSYLWWSVTGAISIGIIMIALISGYLGYYGFSGFASSFGAGVLIAGGSILTGGFLGFMFGIPSILQDPDARVKYNDNLIQISDWLTKIIVGVGLTQLYNVPHFIIQIGEHFQVSFSNNVWGRNVAIAIIGYFFVLGFLMIYFWAKTDYSTIMKYKDDDFNKQLREEREAKELAQREQLQTEQKLQTVKEEKIQAQEETKTMATQIAQKETKTLIDNSAIASDTGSIGNLKQNSNDALSDELDKLKTLVTQTLPIKQITVPDDPQKNRWGGKSENNGKNISAAVTKNEWQNLYNVLLTITNSDKSPLMVPAAIFVHDSYEFPDDVIYATPDSFGKIELSILAYEAFTTGVLFTDGTQLELDLNEQPGYPLEFYWSKIDSSSSTTK